jgi:hypothetical protein
LDKLGKGGNTEDFENDLQMSASAFEALERDFQEVSNLSTVWVLSYASLGSWRFDG